MVCLYCGQPAAKYFSYCIGCQNRHWQYLAGRAGFWHKFTTKSGRYTRQYNFASRPAAGHRFFSGWWPLKLLFFPVWALWKLMQPIR